MEITTSTFARYIRRYTADLMEIDGSDELTPDMMRGSDYLVHVIDTTTNEIVWQNGQSMRYGRQGIDVWAIHWRERAESPSLGVVTCAFTAYGRDAMKWKLAEVLEKDPLAYVVRLPA